MLEVAVEESPVGGAGVFWVPLKRGTSLLRRLEGPLVRSEGLLS